jgi:hypothetical protein
MLHRLSDSARILLLERQYATASPIRKAAFSIIFHNLLITSDPQIISSSGKTPALRGHSGTLAQATTLDPGYDER